MVMFRDFARRKARSVGLTGTSKNEPDGSLTVIAEGEEEALKELIEHLHDGPVLSKVDKVEIKWSDATGQFDGFEIDY